MGIGYKDAVVLYNRHYNDTLETEYYFGTLFENVRIELTQAENISKSGMKDADSFLVKIPNDGTLNYVNPPDWENMSEEEKLKHFTLRSNDFDFVVIAKKDELLIDRELPVGLINSDDYPGKFFQYMVNEKGNCYKVNTIDVYSLIPRFEIGGK
jgi:hypothetical protein|nr:MAG TPA: hypothetical protein [Caudoviricetes sp.]